MQIEEFNAPGTLSTQEAPAAMAHVLVADDDAMFRKILRTWLEKWGYRVTIVEDGNAAWERLQQEDAPRLLILDWMMPGISGVDLASQIRATPTGDAFYILLATARDHTRDLIHGLEAGADDYLSKPFDRNELQSRLEAGKRMLAARL